MAPLPSLPSPRFDPIKYLVRGMPKGPPLPVVGVVNIPGQVVKVSSIVFHPGSQLVFQNPNFPFVVVYADEWHFSGHFEIRRASKINLDGPSGNSAPAPNPTPPGFGADGNNGISGFPGRDGKPGIPVPDLYIFAQTTIWEGTVPPRPANRIDVDALFSFDGYDGGKGGNGGNGSNGTDGNQGAPARDGSVGIPGIAGDCAAGPGWGGRGGNAGVGGMPGYGGIGGDAAAVFMFVAPTEVPVFQAVTVSLRGGQPGNNGNRGNPGLPGNGGAEGDTSGTQYCFSALRFPRNGKVPVSCPFPEIDRHAGKDGNLPLITDYVGFDELQS